jgi:hypothetical protein
MIFSIDVTPSQLPAAGGTFAVTGTATLPANTLVTIYEGSTAIGTTTVTTGQSFILQANLTANQSDTDLSFTISATAAGLTSNYVTLTQSGYVVSPLTISVTPTSLPSSGGSATVTGTTTLANGTSISIYETGSSLPVAATPASNGAYQTVLNFPENSGAPAIQYTLYAQSGTATSTGVYVTVVGSTETESVQIAIGTPMGCTISLAGQTYTEGDTALLLPGTYSISANACSGYTFASWALNGPFTLNGPLTSASSTLTVSNVATTQTGTLTANYSGSPPPPTGYSVSVSSSSCSSMASVSINGTAAKGTIDLDAGNYTVAAPGSCDIPQLKTVFQFAGWQVSGGVRVASASSLSTTMTVSGNGGITATYTISSSAPVAGPYGLTFPARRW